MKAVAKKVWSENINLEVLSKEIKRNFQHSGESILEKAIARFFSPPESQMCIWSVDRSHYF